MNTISIVLLVICCIINYVLSAGCPEYDPFVTPVWPKNKNLEFVVDDVSQESLLVTFKNVGKYVGSMQYVRIAGLDVDSPSIVSNVDFDSGSTATDTNDVFLYSNYSSMFSNAYYSSSENADCTVNYQVQFQIKDILNRGSLFNVVNQSNVIIAEVQFYTGYAVKSRQSSHVWQYHEDLFVARIVINTLVRADGTKDVLNAACSSTVSQNKKGVIICTYTSASPLEMSQFNITVTDSNNMVLYPYYFETTSGNAKVKFQTVDDITGLVEFNAQVDASICIRGADGQCVTTTPYISPENPFSFQTGTGDITIEQEAELLFSTTITRFDAQTDAATIIGASPEFFVLVRTKTPKSAWRVQTGSDKVNVRLTSVPKYNLPNYPDFPVGNTLTTYTSANFPAETDQNVLNDSNICYIVKFDNSNERYSRASETPIIIAVQFNIEQSARRRISQVTAPSGLAITKAMKTGCVGTECELRDLIAASNSSVSGKTVNCILSAVVVVVSLLIMCI